MELELVPQPLFTDDPEECEIPPTMAVTIQIPACKQLAGTIERYENQKKEAIAYYDDRIAKVEERIAYLKRSIQNYLNQQGQKKINTPWGTAFLKSFTTRTWPEDDALLGWAEQYAPDGIMVKREPSRKAILAHIESTGETPPGYTETTEVRLQLR